METDRSVFKILWSAALEGPAEIGVTVVVSGHSASGYPGQWTQLCVVKMGVSVRVQLEGVSARQQQQQRIDSTVNMHAVIKISGQALSECIEWRVGRGERRRRWRRWWF
ncbi:hypothetical protein ElyMa_003633500 [Elysia marginata]|uniref:Uncharacterized protein n=1 Tax=Elysia marginata TaxID=1093978 RepID=A0AAV4ETQ5_9GAST|nr:hypothetical protein ElyMa_003633500 [Elysia marginata]